MYRDLKAKVKQYKSDRDYLSLFANFWNSIFEYDERLFRPDLMEDFLHDVGICAVIKTETSDYTPVLCNLVGGERYADGLFKNAICYDLTTKQYNFDDWRNNPDIAVIFNTPILCADNWIDKNAMILTDIDTSLINNIIFSRQKPIPIARDAKTKNMIDKTLTDLQNGKLETVLADFSFADLANDKQLVSVLDLSDVTKSQYIQYLIHAYDSIFSRTCMLMGLDITDNGKQAQITTDELNRHEDVSLIMPLMWYKSRKEGLAKIGLKIDFSDFMKNRFAKAENTETEEKEMTENEDNRENDG